MATTFGKPLAGESGYKGCLSSPTPVSTSPVTGRLKEFGMKRIQVELRCMHLPPDVRGSNSIDWGKYATKRKKTSKGNRRLERRVKAVAGSGRSGNLDSGRNKSIAGSEGQAG